MCKDDKKWVRMQLALLPEELMLQTFKKYIRAYKQAYEDEPFQYKKVNVARKLANKRLRKYTQQFIF